MPGDDGDWGRFAVWFRVPAKNTRGSCQLEKNRFRKTYFTNWFYSEANFPQSVTRGEFREQTAQQVRVEVAKRQACAFIPQ